MKPKTLILTVVAVTCGLGASYMTSQLLANREPEQVETFKFLVAKRNLNMGDLIKVPADMFDQKDFTKEQAPRDGIANFDDLKGRVLKIPRRAGDPIHAEDLIGDNDPSRTFATNLPAGYRAVGLRISLESSAAGWATLPLSRVDIINTVRRGDDKSSYSHFLLENVLVLAIDGNTSRDENGRAQPGNIVMFALSPEDCLRLQLGGGMGVLTLALRKTNDNSSVGATEVHGDELRNPQNKKYSGTEDSADNGFPAGSGPMTQAIGSLPQLDPAQAQPAVEVVKEVAPAPKAPEWLAHNLVLTEGGSSRVVNYQLDPKTLKTVGSNTDIARTELPKAE
jgi:Flp pilus assembly protein CpaB